MKNNMLDLTILKRVPRLESHMILEIRPLAPLSMVNDMPGSFYKTLLYPSKKMICGLFENMLGWHFSRKMRTDIFNDWKKHMKKLCYAVDIKDYQQGSTYIPLLMDYFELSGKPSLRNFKGMCSYTDLWNKCYRRSDSSMHLNGCKNLDDNIIAERQMIFASSDKKQKEAWFKDHIGQVPCFYTTPTNREYVDLDGIYCLSLDMDEKLVHLLETPSNNICYLGNSEGWVHVSLKK